jgi:hypothetical protein
LKPKSCCKQVKFSGSEAGPFDGFRDGSIQSGFGIPICISNQSVAETVGTNNDNSWVALVDLSHIAVAERQRDSVETRATSSSMADQLAVRTTARYDIQPSQANAAGVELITGVRP